MSTTDLSRIPSGPETNVLGTLWNQPKSRANLFILAAAILVLFWAYIPNLRVLMMFWNDDPNYSHGYLVIPIALFILWQKFSSPEPTDSQPTPTRSEARARPGLIGVPEPKTSSGVMLAPWWGWGFLIAILALRGFAYERNLEWTENVTLIPALAALIWSFGSWPLLCRVWSSIVFLIFMIPLPQAVNNWLAMPLQLLAASCSCFLLQLTGMWAVQQGNVINLSTPHGPEPLDVALACNGLRMMMTMAATVTAAVILIPLPKWKRITLLLSIVPIALVSNMARIVATGWCFYLMAPKSDYRHWAHDVSGWLMMPLALALVGFELGVLAWLVPKQNDEDKPLPLLTMIKKDSDKDGSSKKDSRKDKPRKKKSDKEKLREKGFAKTKLNKKDLDEV